MSETPKDGGPAFPIPNATDLDGYVYATDASGMSMRDYLAVHCDQPGMAEMVQAVGLRYSDYRVWKNADTSLGSFDAWYGGLTLNEKYDLYAKVRYQMADAMLDARKTTSEPDGLVEELVAALEVAQSLMNHMGDQLNAMDVTTDIDVGLSTPVFDAVRAALSRAREGQS